MVCSCAMSSDCVWLQVTFCSCVNETTLFSFLRSLLHKNGRSLHFTKIFVKIQLGDRMVVNDYWTWLSQNIVIDLLATEKSWFSTQPCPVILLLIIHKNIRTICTFCFFYFVFVLRISFKFILIWCRFWSPDPVCYINKISTCCWGYTFCFCVLCKPFSSLSLGQGENFRKSFLKMMDWKLVSFHILKKINY